MLSEIQALREATQEYHVTDYSDPNRGATTYNTKTGAIDVQVGSILLTCFQFPAWMIMNSFPKAIS